MSTSTLFQSLLLLLLFLHSLTPTTTLTFPSDVAALAAFKSSISPSSINPWSCLSSWNFSSDPCLPHTTTHFLCGLQCSSDSTRITAIALDPAGYSGTLSPFLSNLTLLSHLDLSDNSFHGPIPSSLSSLPSLQSLILSSNSFSNALPASLSNLSSLQTLDLSRNALTGALPKTLSSLFSLRTLDLSYNHLSGFLPQMPPNLIELALRGNSLSGPLQKPTFEPLRLLEVAELGANRFDGKLEGWFLLLPSLQQVDLTNNSLTRVEIWKARPGSGDRLVAVDLGFNRIEGWLPAELAAYPSLAALSVRQNRLRGEIPSAYYGAKKGAPFRRLFLDGNFLKGRVPEGFLGKDGGISGSFGDNCLESCPVSVPLCSPIQKPDWVCKQVYGAGGRHRPSLNV